MRKGPAMNDRTVLASLGLALVLAAGTVSGPGPGSGGGVAVPPAAAPASLLSATGGPPISFVENRGQLDPHVTFALRGGDTDIFLGRTGLTYALAAHPADG